MEEITKFDVVSYWDGIQDQYPHVFKVVLRVMCISPSSAGAERDFSGSGLMLSYLRRRMKGTRVETKMFIHSNISVIPLARKRCATLSREEARKRVRARGTFSKPCDAPP